uniref:Reverse transcriptase domain-containing protein n=1 Tax=Sparus aurata TaxID=8175 RepID=A0A671TPK8_SPAAU
SHSQQCITDPEIKKQISEYIHTFMDINKNSINDLPVIWEALKCCLRGELIKIGSFKKKIQQQEESKLLTRIKLLQSSLSNEYKNEIWTELCKLKMKYDDIVRKKTEYKLKRAKLNDYESGEKAGKLLASRLKKQMTKKKISSDDNFESLEKANIGRWSSLPISLWGRLNIVKINILPTVNYILRMLPTIIQKAWFDDLHKAISAFIWHGKKARCSYLRMSNLYKKGGLQLPNFFYYYLSFGCQQVNMFLDPGVIKEWKTIEENMLQSLNIDSGSLCDTEGIFLCVFTKWTPCA